MSSEVEENLLLLAVRDVSTSLDMTIEDAAHGPCRSWFAAPAAVRFRAKVDCLSAGRLSGVRDFFLER